jgi:hypothetical protein
MIKAANEKTNQNIQPMAINLSFTKFYQLNTIHVMNLLIIWIEELLHYINILEMFTFQNQIKQIC